MDLTILLDDILPKVSKPTRYTGNEYNIVRKDLTNIDVRFALAFPDVYEVGMSHLGLKILYHLLNEYKDIYAERVFAPWVDFEAHLRSENIPLFSLETKTALSKFDFIGFTLQYEMSYSNILNMLELAQIPIFSKDRDKNHPVIIAGGPCAFNPEPLAEFIDIFVIGEAEEVLPEILNLYKRFNGKKDKNQFLERVAKIEGVYVPSLYSVVYNEDGTIKNIVPKDDEIPQKIKKRFIKDLDKVYYPEKFIVPFMNIVHDRAMLEIFRGCIRGCRFCQAGMIYRPVREKSSKHLINLAKSIIDATGFGEISLASLSTSDYSELRDLVEGLCDFANPLKVGISLPSLRIDAFSLELAKKVQGVRKSGLTFAPEAGTQRLRNVINKNVTKADLLSSVEAAFSSGWQTIKLYFMIGLPTETKEDLEGIAQLAEDVVGVYKKVKGNTKGLRVNISTSTFVPKPFTPFQWEAQIPLEQIYERQKYLKKLLNKAHIHYSWHEGKVSFIEAVFARGDRRLCKVLKSAHDLGCKFDGWDECFSYEKWMEAFAKAKVNPMFYAYRERAFNEFLPWDIVNAGITKKFLVKELKRAKKGIVTPNCREKCSGCGIMGLGGEICEYQAKI